MFCASCDSGAFLKHLTLDYQNLIIIWREGADAIGCNDDDDAIMTAGGGGPPVGVSHFSVVPCTTRRLKPDANFELTPRFSFTASGLFRMYIAENIFPKSSLIALSEPSTTTLLTKKHPSQWRYFRRQYPSGFLRYLNNRLAN